MPADREQRCRRATGVSLIPFAAVAASFFLPAVRACNQVTTPAQEVAHGAWFGLPPFVLGAVLAVVGAILLIRGRRRRASARVWLGPYRQHAAVDLPRLAPGRLAAFAVAALSTAGAAVTSAQFAGAVPVRLVMAVPIAGLFLGCLWWGVARLDGWTRWSWLALCWVAQSIVPVGMILWSNALSRETPGATVYAVGVAIVAAATLWALAGRRRTRLRRV